MYLSLSLSFSVRASTNDPLLLHTHTHTHTTASLLGSSYVHPECVHSAPLTCELSLGFANHVRLHTSIAAARAEFNLFGTCPEHRKNDEENEELNFLSTYCPLKEIRQRRTCARRDATDLTCSSSYHEKASGNAVWVSRSAIFKGCRLKDSARVKRSRYLETMTCTSFSYFLVQEE